MGMIEGWLDRTPETFEERAIREEGQRIKKALHGSTSPFQGAKAPTR
jgi:hypothetical protein